MFNPSLERQDMEIERHSIATLLGRIDALFLPLRMASLEDVCELVLASFHGF